MRKHGALLASIGSRIRGHIAAVGNTHLDILQAHCQVHSQNCRVGQVERLDVERRPDNSEVSISKEGVAIVSGGNAMNLLIAEQNNIKTSNDVKEMSAELLVAAARSGDRSAFVELCNRHSKKILPRVYRITKNWEDAEDVLQDSLLKAFLRLESFEGRSSFSSWLTRIAINCALMHLRKKHRLEIPMDRTQDDSRTWSSWEPQDRAETPESRYARQEREELLRSAILRLPAMFREVVELRHTHEYSTSEIARALGISVAAAKSRLFRARMAVRSSFAEAAVTS